MAVALLVPAIEGSAGALTTTSVAVVSSAEAYARADRSAGTRKAYEADLRHFAGWCERNGATFLPAAPDALSTYLATLADAGLASTTIARRVAAIAYAHRRSGHDSPTDTDRVQRVLRGIRRTIGTAAKQKAPATARYVRAMVKAVPDTMIGRRDRALLLVGFAAAMRRSELVGLDVADLDRQPDGMLRVGRLSRVSALPVIPSFFATVAASFMACWSSG